MKRTLLTSFALFFFLSCENDINQPTEENPLVGKWTESFSWINTFDCITIGWETHCPEINENSTIEFMENIFEVKILPTSRTHIVEDDTLYTGTYELSNDTVLFYIGDHIDPIKMRYRFENDSLSISTTSEKQIVIMDGDTSYIPTFSPALFIWGNAWGKTQGVFGKIE